MLLAQVPQLSEKLCRIAEHEAEVSNSGLMRATPTIYSIILRGKSTPCLRSCPPLRSEKQDRIAGSR